MSVEQEWLWPSLGAGAIAGLFAGVVVYLVTGMVGMGEVARILVVQVAVGGSALGAVWVVGNRLIDRGS